MKAFPGSFPLPVFDALELDDLVDAIDLAIMMAEMESDAIDKAKQG